MDDPAQPEAMHLHALAGLRRINLISNTTGQLARAIRRQLELARGQSEHADRPITILDIASGGGDVTLGLARYARRQQLDWQFTGCDISARAVAESSARATRLGLNARFITADALGGLPGRYDVAVCTLFLHHLTDDQIVALLKHASNAKHVVISDLRRSRLAYAATWLGTRLLTRSPVVHVDGPLSVRAALTPPELAALTDRAGLVRAQIRRCWPQRMMLTWSRG